ncbi:hypothetical protein F5Y10DRAFT_52877 [Nemania abortiva]|nr:hypothetical protein F5Y10DRAFT_52877 [Nemania abortiva]
MRAKWRKKRVRRLKRKRRKMRARRYVYAPETLESFHTDMPCSTASKQLASTRSQPSSTKRTKHHDNYTPSPPAYKAHNTKHSPPTTTTITYNDNTEGSYQGKSLVKQWAWQNDTGWSKTRTVGQSPSSGTRELFTQHGLWAEFASAPHDWSMKECDSRRSL